LRNTYGLDAWSCWAPGMDAPADWQAWIRGERSVACDAAPEVGELKPLQRRRLSRIGRAAYLCSSRASGDSAPSCTVYCSAHGELERSAGLLHSIAANEPLSPNQFSLSVHNAIAGLTSIFKDWRGPSYSVAAGEDGIGSAFVVAAGALAELGEGQSVLLVCYDDTVPMPFSEHIHDPPPTGVAVALRLSNPDRAAVRLTVERIASQSPGLEHWDQIRHLSALLACGHRELMLETGRARWSWRRS
jgi:hypothetical protein